MIALLAALCLAGTPRIQAKSLLQQIVPHPTGQNGYEEYLKAADIMLEGDAALYLDWQEGDLGRIESEAARGDTDASRRLPLARRLGTMSLLAVRREAVSKLGVALDWIRQGNGKPVRVPVGDRQKFPELMHFRKLAQLAAVIAYVQDSEGSSRPGTDALLEVMDMGDRIGGSVGVALLSGVLMQADCVAAMGGRLDKMSLGDARATIAAVGRVLQRPPSVQSCLEAGVREQDNRFLDVVATLLQLTSQERKRLAEYLSQRNAESLAALAKRFSGPESGWVEPDSEITVPLNPQTVEEIGDAILAMVDLRPRSFGIGAARVRTQLRLLRLAARVVIFKWEHERLPPRLEDAAPREEIADPLTQDSFQYTPMSDRFRVFSKGVPATGEIDILYRQGQGTGGPPPPR